MMISETLATFAGGQTTLTAEARRATIRTVLDIASAAIAGRGTAGGVSALKAASVAFGPGPSAGWFSDRRLAVPGAAFVNAAFSSMLDLDDGHRSASGHPGAAVIPAVLAVAEAIGADAERVLTAIAIGYEIGVRIAGARHPGTFDTFDSGPWCGQAVTAAAGWLRGIGSARLAHAISIAGTTAPGQTATTYTRFMGNHVKEGIPFGTANGLLAVELAAEGFTGPIDLLDDERRYDVPKLVADLGAAWHIETVYFKPYGCCRWAHAAIDAALELVRPGAIGIREIETIEVETFAQALTLNNEAEPRTLEAAQYSLPFCIAAAIVRGADSLTPIEEHLLADRDVLAVARRVNLRSSADLDPMFPKRVPARVQIETGRGRQACTVLDPRGEPSNPLTDNDLTAKFSKIAHSRLAASAAGKVLEAISALDAGSIRPLMDALAETRLLAHVPGTAAIERVPR